MKLTRSRSERRVTGTPCARPEAARSGAAQRGQPQRRADREPARLGASLGRAGEAIEIVTSGPRRARPVCRGLGAGMRAIFCFSSNRYQRRLVCRSK